MTRKRILSMLALVALVASFAGATSPASAQCCYFTAGGPNLNPACYPVTLTMIWGGNMTQTVVIPGPGMHTFPVLPPCPPAPMFVAAATASNTCCVTPQIAYDPNGCVTIFVQEC